MVWACRHTLTATSERSQRRFDTHGCLAIFGCRARLPGFPMLSLCRALELLEASDVLRLRPWAENFEQSAG